MTDLHRSQYRLPAALYEQLQAAADAAGRSLNAEVVHRLEASFQPASSSQAELQELIEQAVRRALATPPAPSA